LKVGAEAVAARKWFRRIYKRIESNKSPKLTN